MKCYRLHLSGVESCSSTPIGRYQQIVFIHKDDLESYETISELDSSSFPELEPMPNHYIKFKLKENTEGLRFKLSENSTIINGTFQMVKDGSIPRYKHSISLGIRGVSESSKWQLKQFALSKDYFAVLQHKSNVLEVFGFHNGLSADSYDYDNEVVLTLNSSFNEYDLPYIYKSETFGYEIKEFDSNFSQKDKLYSDFNNDYNKDFNN